MDAVDRQALKNFDPAKNQFLIVKGKGEKEHLEIKKLNAWNRFTIYLGLSSKPSLVKVANYIKNHPEKFKDLTDVDKASLRFLRTKFKKYNYNRTESISFSDALNTVDVKAGSRQLKRIINYVPLTETQQKEKLEKIKKKIDKADKTGDYYTLFGLKPGQFDAKKFLFNAHALFLNTKPSEYPQHKELAKEVTRELNNISKMFMKRVDLKVIKKAIEDGELFSSEASKDFKILRKEANRILHLTDPRNNPAKDAKLAKKVHDQVKNRYEEIKADLEQKKSLR